MKSAYELAMERLEKASGPSKKLTDEQKAAIAEVEKKYEARIAEQRLVFDSKIASASSLEEMEQIKAELAQTIASLEEHRDREKDAIWKD